MAVTRTTTMAEFVRQLLQQVRAAGITVRYTLLDRGFYSVEVIRYLQRARAAFLIPVIGRGRSVKHSLDLSGANVFKQRKVRLEPVHADGRKEEQGHSAGLYQVPELAWGARPVSSGGLGRRLLGPQSEAVRLSGTSVPDRLRDRDQRSSDESVPDPDDVQAIRGAVTPQGDRVLAAQTVGMAASHGPLEAAAWWVRASTEESVFGDDAAWLFAVAVMRYGLVDSASSDREIVNMFVS